MSVGFFDAGLAKIDLKNQLPDVAVNVFRHRPLYFDLSMLLMEKRINRNKANLTQGSYTNLNQSITSLQNLQYFLLRISMPSFPYNDCSFKDRDLSDSSIPDHSIFVKPLPIDIEEQDLRFLFSPCGPIDRITIPKQYKDSYYAFAFIRFFKEESIQKAQKYYDGKMLGLKKIRVKYAQVRDYSKMTKNQKQFSERFQTETVYDDGSQRHSSKPHKKIHSNEEVSKQSSNKDSYQRNLSHGDKFKNQCDDKFSRKEYDNGYKNEKKDLSNRWKSLYHEPQVPQTQFKKHTMKEQNKFTRSSDTKSNGQKDKFSKANTKKQNDIEY